MFGYRKTKGTGTPISESKLSRWPVKSTLYKGRKVTDTEMDLRDESRPLLLIDDAYSKRRGEKILIAAYIAKSQREEFRRVAERHNHPTKGGHERKYRNTSLSERLIIYRDLNSISFEITDTFDVPIPANFVGSLPFDTRKNLDERERRYIFLTYVVIKEVLRRHPGRIDIVLDNPPYDIWNELMELCKMLVANGYNIVWYTVTPSGTLKELWLQDYVAGLTRDVRDMDQTIEWSNEMRESANILRSKMIDADHSGLIKSERESEPRSDDKRSGKRRKVP